MPEQPPSRVAVIGAGSFGRNHLRVWRELERAGLPVQLSAIVEPGAAVADNLAAEYRVPIYRSIDELLVAQPLPQAASVAVPTSLHFKAAAQLLAAGIDVLLEKPIADTLEQADDLIQISERNHRILQIGHLERFNPAVRAVRAIVHRPLFFEVHRLSVFTPRSLDVDVVLDLMIHDLDVVLRFVQSPIRELHAVGLPVLSPKIDIANVRIEFQSGCVANFTASRISTERVRKMRFFQPHQYISIDYARQDVLWVDVADSSSHGAFAAAMPFPQAVNFQPAEQRHPTPEFAMKKLEVLAGEPLRLEMESFLQAVRHRTQPEVSAREGRAALALALDIRAAIQEHQSRAGVG
ncbi:MAG: Gfo/Idh/MocA family oxidoreductase [Acidobacteriaceae bacterium]